MGLFDDLKEAINKAMTPEETVPVEDESSDEMNPALRHYNVDVAVELQKKADAHSEDLDWQRSIVDLMKLVEMDSSYQNRKAMAIELGYPEGDIESKGSAEMNMWLHQKVLVRLAEEKVADTTIWAGYTEFPDRDGMA